MMTYIAPGTNVLVCRNVPLDNSYKHTILFDSASDQLSYFTTMSKYTFDAHSYQRSGKGKIRVQELCDNLITCNYLCFQNEAFGDKWFYCFITDCEYINNITTEITYEIDVLQTWLFNWTYDYCLVERQHTETDEIGEHVILENLPFGDLVVSDITRDETLLDTQLMWSTAHPGSALSKATYSIGSVSVTTIPGMYAGGLPSGTYICAGGDASDPDAMLTALDYINTYYVDTGYSDSMICLWIQPTATSAIVNNWTSSDSEDDYDPAFMKSSTNSYFYAWLSAPVYTFSVAPPTNISGYTPRNNKLFCYPYNSLCVDAGDDSAVYRWEWFYNADDYGDYRAFMVWGTTNPNAEVMISPVNYNGEVNWSADADPLGVLSYEPNFTESLILRNWPQIGWSVDAYRAWVADGGYIDIGLSAIGGLLGGGQAAAAYDESGRRTSGLFSVANSVVGSASSIKNEVVSSHKGSTGRDSQTVSVMAALQAKTFYYKYLQCQYEYAVMIDDYFTRYGYLLNQLRVPNRRAREHFTYIKTANCTIHPTNVPADAAAKIEEIHDHGVTWWMAPSYVGNYTLDNTPAGE